MGRALQPGETVWLTWSQVQRELEELDRARRAYRSMGPWADRMMRRALGPQPPEPQTTRSPAEDRDSATDEPSFCIGYLPRDTYEKIVALYATGRAEDVGQGIELFVRYGVRGHKGLRDATGREVPFHFARPEGSLMPIDELTFEAYHASGIAIRLAEIVHVRNSPDLQRIASLERRRP